ncbi:MAG: DUF2961 domain-containing protein [Acidobacteria bacterium]|nr:DUF2961 domain-containing protein [Acidobacteriota bacterium]
MKAAILLVILSAAAGAQSLSELAQPHDYVQHRSSSYDRSGANADFREIPAGGTLTLMDEDGPGEITHFWCTIATRNADHLKAMVLRMYWDGESTPSVEAPIGDFFGQGLGEYHPFESTPLKIGSIKALNSFFSMPFARHARITVTNESSIPTEAYYYNIDWRAYRQPLPPGTLYFHAQFRQAAPNRGWTNQWTSNGDPRVEDRKNLTGEGNYVFLEAQGHGHFAGVTLSVLQNQDGWWGEGDDMIFVDGEKLPSINGTGSEDYFLGAWDFGGKPFAYSSFGAPVVGEEKAGSRSSVYRFHLDSPVPFTRSIRVTIEHGHANHRSDNYYSVAYWYQAEPHAAFPPLPPLNERLLKLFPVGGPGNAEKLP